MHISSIVSMITQTLQTIVTYGHESKQRKPHGSNFLENWPCVGISENTCQGGGGKNWGEMKMCGFSLFLYFSNKLHRMNLDFLCRGKEN